MSQFRIVPTVEGFERWGDFCQSYNVGKKDLLITDRIIYDKYLKTTPFSGVIIQDDYGAGEPTDEKISSVKKVAEGYDFSRVIAVGGGTVIDIAKLIATDGWNSKKDDVLRLFKKEIEPTKTKQLIIIPTTCGTGSEVTNISVSSFPDLGTKVGLASDQLYADNAVLVSELIESLPFKVFMHSSVDALIHAIESFLSPKANAFTEIYSLKAIETIIKGYKYIAENGDASRADLLGDFLLAANMAGIAFSNAGCGLIHAMSYPIGGTYHLPHGESNYEVMFAALRFYSKRPRDRKIELLEDLIGSLDEVERLIDKLVKRRKMREFGMTSEQAKKFSADVIKNQQRLLANCYIDTSESDIESIYLEII